MLALADILAQNNVQRVTIGGGEPLLRKDLEEILARLKQSGIFVSLHTNGTILLPRLDRLKGLVDILSLPLDSVYERQNRRMRGIPYVEMIDQIIEATQGKFKLAFKTTATKINARSLHKIYDKISRTDFDYWKVYQFRALNDAKKYENTFELPDEEFEQVKTKLSRYHDPRIHPLSKKEGHQAYVFLDNQGNISTVHPLKEENIQVGNLHPFADQRIDPRRVVIPLMGVQKSLHLLHELSGARLADQGDADEIPVGRTRRNLIPHLGHSVPGNPDRHGPLQHLTGVHNQAELLTARARLNQNLRLKDQIGKKAEEIGFQLIPDRPEGMEVVGSLEPVVHPVPNGGTDLRHQDLLLVSHDQ